MGNSWPKTDKVSMETRIATADRNVIEVEHSGEQAGQRRKKLESKTPIQAGKKRNKLVKILLRAGGIQPAKEHAAMLVHAFSFPSLFDSPHIDGDRHWRTTQQHLLAINARGSST